MKLNPFLHAITALPFAVLLTSTSLASPVEPRRMYDAEKGQYVDNPDYHEVTHAVTVARPRNYEPRRVYDLEKERFVANPDYHEATPVATVARPKNYEPRRMYDAESGQYVANPDFRKTVTIMPTVVVTATHAQPHRVKVLAHKKIPSRHTARVAKNHRAA